MGIGNFIEIRAIPTLAQIPIVAISASLFEIRQRQEQLKAFDGFLPKPIDINHLLALIGELLNLTWVYAQDALQPQTDSSPAHAPPPTDVQEASDHATLAPMLVPPLEMMEGIDEMVLLGDMWNIQAVCQRLMIQEPHYRPFLSEVETLAESFDGEKLMMFLQKHLALHV